MPQRFTQTQQGFTLIEILVSTAIFVIVVSALASSMLYVSKLQRRTNALRTANDNVRYITDFFSKEIRNGVPNFDGTNAVLTGCGTYNTNAVDVQNWFQLTNVSGDQECIFLGNINGQAANSTGPYIWITKEPAGSTTPLPPQQLNIGAAEVTSLTFTIANPGSIQSGAREGAQPYVLITGTVVSNRDPQNVVSVPFETSVSIPIYGIPDAN